MLVEVLGDPSPQEIRYVEFVLIELLLFKTYNVKLVPEPGVAQLINSG